VAAVVDSSRANIDRVRRLLSSPRRHAVTLAEHNEIFHALEVRNAQAAHKAMAAHLEAVMEELGRFSVEHADAFVHT
jgi:DNA-binding FadR family transcriptional regulator